MTTSRAALCARNNSLWGDAVCRAHGRPGEFLAGLWLNRRPVPRFYSNLITLSPKDPAGQRAWVAHLLTRRAHFSVKDSFAALDLRPLGFDVLFEATWLWHDPVRRTQESATHPGVVWSVVTDAAGLARWEAAWAGLHDGQAVPGSERVFRDGLLHEPGVALLAGARDGQIVAVAAANQTGDVVGLSNVFAPAVDAAAVWAKVVDYVGELFPGRPLVGYERGDDLAAAEAAGFRPVGPLRVWAR
jgi:hypothetical protein